MGSITMKIKSIGYFFKQALLSVWRNGWMSVASLLTVIISLFTLGGFLLLGMNMESMARTLENTVEVVVWVDTESLVSDVNELGAQLETLPGVSSVKLVTKEEGMAKINQQYGDKDLLMSLAGINPLPDYFVLKTREPRMVDEVAGKVERLQFVEKVDYGQKEVDRLFEILKWVRLIGYAAAVLLALASVSLVAITIRLTVFARQDEIEIMRYVGAANWFIRAPFFVEGILLGFLGAVAASLGLYVLYGYLIGWLGARLNFLPFVQEINVILPVLLYLVLGGAVLGGIGSVVSVQRYLKV